MKVVGVISDTHCVFPDIVRTYLADVDEIWHLGDIFSQSCFDEINSFKPITKAVKGNWETSDDLPVFDSFFFEGKKIFMIHKGLLFRDGHREFYDGVWEQIRNEVPNIILCGHTHHFDYCTMVDLIPLVGKRVLCINPGAVTPLFHEQGSCLKFTFSNRMLTNVERLSYDCPTVRLRFSDSLEEGRQCLLPSVYKRQKDFSLPTFEQLDIIEERPLNVRVEKVLSEDWHDGSSLEFPRRITEDNVRNPWKREIVLGYESKH